MADRFDKFTERARRALQAAQEEAVRLSHGEIGANHLLLGVLHDRTNVATHALAWLNLDLDQLASEAAKAANQAPVSTSGGLSEGARKAIQLAVDEARKLDHHYIGTEHLLLGLVREGSTALAEALPPTAESLQRARTAIAAVLNAAATPTPRPMPTAPGGGGRSTSTTPRASEPTTEDRELLLERLSVFLGDPTKRPAEAEAGLFGQFAEPALRVLLDARDEARRLKHSYIGTEHLLLGLVGDGRSAVSRLLSDLGADLPKVRNAVEFIIGRGDRPPSAPVGLTPRAQRVLFLALDEAQRLGQARAGAEHILLGIIREGEGIASGVLESLVVSTDRIRTQMLEYLGQPQLPPTPARVSRGGRSVLLQAQLVARWYYHTNVDTEHLLVGLVRDRGIAARVLQDLGVQLPALLEQFAAVTPADTGERMHAGLGYSLAAQAALERATWEAEQRDQARACSGHLLLGVLAIEGGRARDLLEGLGVSLEAVRLAVEPLLASDDE